MLCRCRRQCGAALARAMRRAAKGNLKIRCLLATHCVPNVVGAACPGFGRPCRPPHYFLRGTLFSRYESSQSHPLVCSCHPKIKKYTCKIPEMYKKFMVVFKKGSYAAQKFGKIYSYSLLVPSSFL